MMEKDFSRYMYPIFNYIMLNLKSINDEILLEQKSTNLFIKTKNNLMVIWKYRFHMRSDKFKSTIENCIIKLNLFYKNKIFPTVSIKKFYKFINLFRMILYHFQIYYIIQKI